MVDWSDKVQWRMLAIARKTRRIVYRGWLPHTLVAAFERNQSAPNRTTDDFPEGGMPLFSFSRTDRYMMMSMAPVDLRMSDCVLMRYNR